MRKYSFFVILFSLHINILFADDFTDTLQWLTVEIACIGQYSSAQTGVYVISYYDDPPDWYEPILLANYLAAKSGNMTRTNTFYGVCFDYAQFAWDELDKNYQFYKSKGVRRFYIAATDKYDPYTITLYDPVPKEKATTINNGVYLKEHERRKVYAHEGATGHAWLWIQRNDGTWYWIDPTWTDNTGWVWWGKVENGKEVTYYPNPDYCVADNYPGQSPANYIPPKQPTSPNYPSSSYQPPPSNQPVYSPPSYSPPKYSNNNGHFFIGYNYENNLPLGATIGWDYVYFSINFGAGGTPGVDGMSFSLLNQEGQYMVAEYIFGGSFYVFDYLQFLGGLGGNISDPDGDMKHILVFEVGLRPVLFNFLYISATYRLIGFTKSGYTLGAGFAF